MAQSSRLLPRMSWAAGKLLTLTGVAARDLTVKAARESARLAGECAREFVDGLKEGKAGIPPEPVTISSGAADRIQRAMATCAQQLGGTDGDLQICGTCQNPQAARNRCCTDCGTDLR